jgi:two-component system, OmpR family, response regulator
VPQADVLVLEDEELVRILVVEILEQEGLCIHSTADPQDALTELNGTESPCLLVTDIDLGVANLNGFEVARQARLLHPDLLVIFMSGRTWLLSQHLASRTDRMLPKPFRSRQLLQMIEDLRSSHSAP